MQCHRFRVVFFSVVACVMFAAGVRGQAGPKAFKASMDQSSVNLKQIGLGLLMYCQDFDEKLPPMQSMAAFKKAVMPYLKSDSVFLQPGTKKFYQPNTSLSHKPMVAFKSPASMVAFFEAGPASDGTRGVVFLDGHVKRFPEAAWPALRRASHIPDPPAPKRGG